MSMNHRQDNKCQDLETTGKTRCAETHIQKYLLRVISLDNSKHITQTKCIATPHTEMHLREARHPDKWATILMHEA
jgi:hypothetical protein